MNDDVVREVTNTRPGNRKARLDAPPSIVRITSTVVAVGIALRFVQLLNGRPLWLDEAMLALSIIPLGFRDFFRPLDHSQISPLGFLLVQSLLRRLVGSSELALRVFPFAAGVCVLLGFARLSRRLLDQNVAVVATALAALSPLLIDYSAEVKSYGLDALTAILLVHATLDCAERGLTRCTQFRWALAAALTAFLSTPAPFTVGGSALALVVAPHVRNSPRALLRLVAVSVPATLIFALQMFTAYHSPPTTSFMQSYWADAFLEPELAPAIVGLAYAARQLWLAMLFGGAADAYLPRATLPLMLGLSVAGILLLARSNRLGITLLLAPLALAICASLAHWWPLTPRLLLFGAPAVFITLSAGLAAVARLAPAWARLPVLGAMALVVVSVEALGIVSMLRAPPRFEPVPEAMAHVGQHHGRDATVYVSRYLVPACTYYAAWHPDRSRLVGNPTGQHCKIRGVRTIYGEWPVGDSSGASLSVDGQPTVSAAWVVTERTRILDAATSELWLIIKHGPKGADVVIPAIERAGAIRFAERRLRGITIYAYHMPPNPRLQQPRP